MDNNNNNKDFEEMLCDVRKSFRLLHQYNERVLDLMRYIGSQFGAVAGGYPHASGPCPKGGKGIERWAWDWLNMHFYEFHFANAAVPFSVMLQSDTGTYDSNVDWNDIPNFDEVTKAQTRLIFISSSNPDEYWEFGEMLEDGDIMYKNLTGKGKVVKAEDSEEKMYLMAFNLVDFADKASIDKTLQKWLKFLNDNGETQLTLHES
ncbi:MAG: hypothetical protein FWE37_03585 [Spirochaetaceae bacterium]|nr:hypothetical protein [Spirochaetaceae bacterium]